MLQRNSLTWYVYPNGSTQTMILLVPYSLDIFSYTVAEQLEPRSVSQDM